MTSPVYQAQLAGCWEHLGQSRPCCDLAQQTRTCIVSRHSQSLAAQSYCLPIAPEPIRPVTRDHARDPRHCSSSWRPRAAPLRCSCYKDLPCSHAGEDSGGWREMRHQGNRCPCLCPAPRRNTGWHLYSVWQGTATQATERHVCRPTTLPPASLQAAQRAMRPQISPLPSADGPGRARGTCRRRRRPWIVWCGPSVPLTLCSCHALQAQQHLDEGASSDDVPSSSSLHWEDLPITFSPHADLPPVVSAALLRCLLTRFRGASVKLSPCTRRI
jgi:hypothetical protein